MWRFRLADTSLLVSGMLGPSAKMNDCAVACGSSAPPGQDRQPVQVPLTTVLLPCTDEPSLMVILAPG